MLENINELVKKAQEGDKDALIKIVTNNIALVRYAIKKLNSYYTFNEDFISVGKIFLIKAIEGFDETRNIKFTTYAYWCIRHGLINEFKNKNKHENIFHLNNENPLDENLEEYINGVADNVNVVDVELKIDLQNALNSLDQRSSDIVTLSVICEKTYEEIGKKYDISRERVRQIRDKALKVLAKKLEVYA